MGKVRSQRAPDLPHAHTIRQHRRNSRDLDGEAAHVGYLDTDHLVREPLLRQGFQRLPTRRPTYDRTSTSRTVTQSRTDSTTRQHERGCLPRQRHHRKRQPDDGNGERGQCGGLLVQHQRSIVPTLQPGARASAIRCFATDRNLGVTCLNAAGGGDAGLCQPVSS
jgi:hypothetical protein